MTMAKRFISIGLAGVLGLSIFALGRWTRPETASATETTPAPVAAASPTLPAANIENSSFYLSDYKTGYNDGYTAGLTSQSNSFVNSSRPGYNEGFKEGYANGHQAQAQAQIKGESQPVQLMTSNVSRTLPARTVTNYRTVEQPVYTGRRSQNSKLKTALTIAAPAAIGAGIGAMAGGKKGAGAGALIGGGGGALYHLWKKQ